MLFLIIHMHSDSRRVFFQISLISVSHPEGPVLLPKASVNGDTAPVIPEEIGTGTCLIMETDTPESDLSL